MTREEFKGVARAALIGTTLYAMSVALVFGLFVLLFTEEAVDYVLTNYAPVFVASVLAAGFWITLYALEFWAERRDS